MSRKQKRVARRVQAPTVWEAMNQPVVEVTKDAANAIFFVAAVFFLAIWIMPYLGSARVAYADTVAPGYDEPYVSVFGGYEAKVAGAAIVAPAAGDEATEGPKWYSSLTGSTDGFGYYLQQSFTAPFSQAVREIFDISEPVGRTMAFYQPGVSAVWNAWLELMADPAY